MESLERLLDWATPRMVLPAYRRLMGDCSLRLVEDVERVNAAKSEDIRAHQLRRLRAICALAARDTEFYAERFQAAGLEYPDRITLDELQRVPVLTKEDLRTQADRIRNRRIPYQELRASATGGTTAAPVRIYMDWNCYYHRRAATIAFDRWFGYEPGMRMALLWGASQDIPALSSVRSRLRMLAVERTRFLAASPLDATVMERYAAVLRRFRPALLQAYPSPLEIFARFLKSRGLSVPVGAISCTAEPLLPHQASLIESAFGRKPLAWYGSRECGRVATEMPGVTGLFVNAYGLYVEIVRDEAFAHSELGRIVISDLWNEGFPLIRYDTGDVGALCDGALQGGPALPRLNDVTGRVADTFVNSKGQRIPGIVFHRAVQRFDEVRELQLIQRDVRRFEVMVVPGPLYGPDTSEMLRRTVDGFMQEENDIAFRLVDEVPRERSGKRRLCKNLMNVGEEGTLAARGPRDD